MDPAANRRALEQIRENIEQHGHHIYIVAGQREPRFAYTIGLSPQLGYELIFGGGLLYENDDVFEVMEGIAAELRGDPSMERRTCEVGSLGRFSFRRCDLSWSQRLMLGAADYYQRDDVAGLQIVPDEEHLTIDVPDMAIPWSLQTAPAWRDRDDDPWPYSVPETSHAATDLLALRGLPVTRACRWEDDYWELFADEEQSEENMRIVGLAMLLAADPSLAAVLDLNVGECIQRTKGGVWRVWG